MAAQFQPRTMAQMPAPATLPPYTTLFEFEHKFDYVSAVGWMQQNWHTSFYWAAAYLVLIFSGRAVMKSMARFELKKALFAWNLLLATFSILGAYRMIPELMHMLKQPDGFHQSICLPLGDHNPVFGFWTFLFILSKAPELGDTVFIVLRKQPLIFLHYYHHVTVLIYSWLTHAEYAAPSRWYIVMNLTVHSAMYSYYAARALGYRFPKSVSVLITSSQILQMAMGVVVNVHAFQSKTAGLSCDVSFLNIYLALGMYGSYFALFANFFYKSYLSPGGGGASGGPVTRTVGGSKVSKNACKKDKNSNHVKIQ